MTKYEKNIYDIAKKMTNIYWNKNKSNPTLRFEDLTIDIQKIQIVKMLTTAETVLALQADQVRELYESRLFEDTLLDIEKYLIKRGLIPCDHSNIATDSNEIDFCKNCGSEIEPFKK